MYSPLTRLQSLRTAQPAALCNAGVPMEHLTQLSIRPLRGKAPTSARAAQPPRSSQTPTPWHQLPDACPNLVALRGVTEKPPLDTLRALRQLSTIELGPRCVPSHGEPLC